MHKLSTKPRIRLTGKAVWQCADAHLARSGRSWKQAYDRWLLASLRDAEAKSAPASAKQKKVAEFRNSANSAANPPLRQAGTALPKKAGKPITLKAAPKVEPIEQPRYHESAVKQLPGSLGRREYRPPVGLMRNMDRAAAVQRPLISISSGEGSQ